MSGLMMIFMLVAIVYMVQVKRNEARIIEAQERAKEVVRLYSDLRAQLYQDLESEFRKDFAVWKATVQSDLSIRFEEPSVQFDTGSSVVKEGFKSILDSFFPRYIAILRSPKYLNAIEEVRIEGHTSSFWRNLSPELAYYENMRLSQERTRGVLTHVFGIEKIKAPEVVRWLVERLTANGLSSSRLLMLPDGRQDVVPKAL
jgi:outer membrane protein OmpA-like peptidoglycan-associated protein